MIAYLDSSAVLRFLLKDPEAIPDFFSWKQAFSSELLRLECRRTFHRLRLANQIDDDQFAALSRLYADFQNAITIVRIDEIVLERAGDPFSVSIGSLDAIHLATALLWRPEAASEKVVFTHDQALRTAAVSFGLPVLG